MAIDRILAKLRTDAEAGDPDAARDYGRLLCLVPDGFAKLPNEGSAERWLRAACAARPDDAEAAVLLAAELLKQADDMSSPDYLTGQDDVSDYLDDDDGESDRKADEAEAARQDGIDRRQEQARGLYEHVLRADPTHPAARAGLALEFDVTVDDGPISEDYSFYVAEAEYGAGALGAYMRLVVTSFDELRWACANWFEDAGPDTLTVYSSGVRLRTIDMAEADDDGGSLDWETLVIPPLEGRNLPVGHPVDIDGAVVRYGLGTTAFDR